MDNSIRLQSFGVTVNWTVSCTVVQLVCTTTKRPARCILDPDHQMTKFLLEILTFSHGSGSGIYLRSLPLLRSDLLCFSSQWPAEHHHVPTAPVSPLKPILLHQHWGLARHQRRICRTRHRRRRDWSSRLTTVSITTSRLESRAS